MWNSIEFQCPTSDLVAYPPADQYIMENLRDFVTVLTTSADTLTSESPLWSEMNILHNIQAKYKRILKCDRFLIFLQRVGHCLRKMVLLNLSKSYLDLAERFLLGFQDFSGTPLLPSRQQVEYILMRTLSASRLVCEAITYSRESFCYLIQKLKVGHLILDLIMATSVIARLNILLRATLEQLSSMYKQVLFWRYKIKKGEFQWAEKFDFPQDVEDWIKSFEPTYSKPLSLSKEDTDRVKSMLNQIKGINNDVEMSDTESIILVNEINEDSPDISVIEIDYGEVIPRTIDEISKKSMQKKKVKTNQELMEQKQVEITPSLTKMQKSLLEKIVKVKSLKQLSDVWYHVHRSSQECYPGILTKKRIEKINKLFAGYPCKKLNKTYKTRPDFLKKAIISVCKKLGFSNDHITMCKKTVDCEPNSSGEVKILDFQKSLVPVKSEKKLKLLYNQLKEILEFKNESDKLQSLKTIYKHRLTNIKHLKEESKPELARKLISCTSKEFLALYQ